MILQLKLDVKDEAHQNEVLNRVEATGAQVLEAHGIVGDNAYPIEGKGVSFSTQEDSLVRYPVDMPDQPEMVAHMPFLEYLASHCSTIVEIGCGHGNGSTRAFERGMKSSLAKDGKGLYTHITVDIDLYRPEIRPTSKMYKRGTYIYTQIVGDSRLNRSRDLVAFAGSPISMLYIDTEHTYDVMKAELENWTPLITQETILVFHDTWMFGAYNHMTDAIQEWALAHNWEFHDFTKVSHGLGLMFHPESEWAKNVAMLEASYERFYRDIEPK